MASPARRPQRKRRDTYHHGSLRQALIDQAVQTIRQHGVDGLTLRGVGADLRASRTALYRHFADKGALLAAVATDGFRTFHAALTEAWEAGGRGRAGFEAMGLAYVRFAVANPSHYRVMFGGFVDHAGADPELITEANGAFQVLVDSLIEQQGRGLIAAGDPRQLALYVWAIVHGIAMLGIDGQLPAQQSAEDLTLAAMRCIRDGIRGT
jgi:AcrR family transcriptional regulator